MTGHLKDASRFATSPQRVDAAITVLRKRTAIEMPQSFLFCAVGWQAVAQSWSKPATYCRSSTWA